MSRLVCGLTVLVALVLLAGCAERRSLESNMTVRTHGDAMVYGVYRSGGFGSGRR